MRLIRQLSKPLVYMAAPIKRRFLTNTTFISVTGSVGKTTATELLSAILSERHTVRMRAFSNTPHFVLATVLVTKRSDEFVVLEVSGGNPGDIEKSRDVVRPQIGVVTLAGLDHYRNYRTREAVAAEKGKIVDNLPADGFAILNGDDPNVRAISSRTKAQVIYFGTSEACHVRATDITAGWPQGLSFTVHYEGQSRRVHSKLNEEIWVVSIVAAISAALVLGVSIDECVRHVEKFEPLFARMSTHTTKDGVNFVLETAKAPNWTMPYAIDFVTTATALKKTVVLGKISDVSGSYNQQLRKWTRRFLAIADRVICIGHEAKAVERLATGEYEGRLFVFGTTREADEFLQQTTTEGEMVFVKSGASHHLERLWLNREGEINCWLEPCPIRRPCFKCRWYNTRSPARPAGRLVKLLR